MSNHEEDNGPQQVKFKVRWSAEPAAGLYGGSDEVTISFKDGWVGGIPEETIEFLSDSLSDLFDGADVEVVALPQNPRAQISSPFGRGRVRAARQRRQVPSPNLSQRERDFGAHKASGAGFEAKPEVVK